MTSSDLDNNGYLDIAITSQDLHNVRILFNDGTGNFVEEPQVKINNDELIINNCNLSNYPNPFNPVTTISYNLPVNIKNPVIEIFNVKGEKVRKLEVKSEKLGVNKVVWNGKDGAGKKVASGVYLYRLNQDGKTIATKKMIMMK